MLRNERRAGGLFGGLSVMVDDFSFPYLSATHVVRRLMEAELRDLYASAGQARRHSPRRRCSRAHSAGFALQSHVFDGWEALGATERESLLVQLRSFDPARVNQASVGCVERWGAASRPPPPAPRYISCWALPTGSQRRG